ncbi:hypothetical protein [Clostridium sp. B9]|uniref:hypothetical protein n=1 Tax=Clostridium sp. B9 TaxID=3423224 RepID=UPI003D2F07B7
MAIIKQCKSCEKKGVFLKLYKGLCQECADELNFLEKQYYKIENILSDSLEINNPNEIIEQAKIILNNIDKFQNTYTPIRKSICLEVISLMENLLIDEDLEDEMEPIYIYPEEYEKNNITSPEITLNKMSTETIEEDVNNEISKLNNVTTNSLENIEVTENTTQILKEKDEVEPSINEPIDNSFTIPDTIVLDEDKIQNLSSNNLEEQEVIIKQVEANNEGADKNSFENIDFKEECVDEKVPIEEEIINVSKPLDELRKLLDNIEKSLNDSNFNKSINKTNTQPTDNEFNNTEQIKINSETKESNYTDIAAKQPSLDLYQEKEEKIQTIEKKSIKDLARDSMLILGDDTLSPEEKGYNLEVLKNYSSELYKEGIYQIDNVNLNKFISKKEKQLLKLINKPAFDLFNFFNYVSFSLIKEDDDIYILSAVKICYGKIIDNFYSKYSIKNLNSELDTLEDVSFRFTKFIDNMMLVTHNANFTISNLKSSFSKVKGIYINNKFICTRNSYLKLCSKLNISKPDTMNLYVCLRHFLSNEEIEEINEESSVNFVDAIKTFKLYEKLKYLIK